MSSSEDESVIIMWQYLRRRKKRKFWVHPYIVNNYHRRAFVAAKELQGDPQKFHAFYRMNKDSFAELLRLVGPAIQKKDTNFRRCLSVEERLLITLRYLATGCNFASLSFYFARGDNTIGKVVATTTRAIWDCLCEEYMPVPSEDRWNEIADRFSQIWNIPNCLGAVDGKHIRIQKFPKSGSTNINYKSYHSIVLMAACDANGLFTMIDVGHAGRNSDGGVFRASRMGRWMERRNGLNFPSSRALPYTDHRNKCNFYFVADEAFPLKVYMMRPYPRRSLTDKKIIFNYRISRARKTIECTFGMMSKKFQVLMTPILCTNKHTVSRIVRSVCILHNFVRKREGHLYQPYIHSEENMNLYTVPDVGREDLTLPPRITANNLRDYLANYFITPEAALPWQWKYCTDV